MHGLNLYDYHARQYDPVIGQFTTMDPLCEKYYHISPYAYCAGNPIKYVDPDGKFPILVNGRVSNDSERKDASYWDNDVLNTIYYGTGYSLDSFWYVDGDRGLFAPQRYNNGRIQGRNEASAIYERLKETIVNGEIAEQLQVFSHSRGSAFAAGYMNGLTSEILKFAEEDGLIFKYGAENLIEYSVNLAPHQSNEIYYNETGATNVNVSHYGDPLSGNDAKGSVINIHSNIGYKLDQHGNATYNKELRSILNILNLGGNVKNNLSTFYGIWDDKNHNIINSTVQ